MPSEYSARELLELSGLEGLNSLAIIGTEKNAGKTSTLNHLIEAAHVAAFPRELALTSIGRDGETKDVVNQGQKPRVYVFEDSLIATSGIALKNSDALLDIRNLSGIHSAFGEITIARCLSDGYVELAGPSQAEELRRCETLMRQEEKDCCYIVDGALSRRSSAGGGITEALILAISLDDATTLEDFIKRAQHAVKCLLLPEVDGTSRESLKQYLAEQPDCNAIAISSEGDMRRLCVSTLLGAQGLLEEFIQSDDTVLLLRGAVTDQVLQGVLHSELKGGTTVVVEDGSRVFLSPRSFALLARKKIEIRVLHPLDLRFVNFNPRDRRGRVYKDANIFERLKQELPCPVINLGPALRYRT